ncbi:monocarboxylate transporter 13-like [Saccoglossus kowalevskii]
MAPKINPDHTPDGGWGWVIVFSALVIQMIAAGSQLTTGLLFLTLKNYFGESAATTAWVLSLSNSVLLLSGPLGTYLSSRLGVRPTVFIGGLMSTIGFFLGSFGLLDTYGWRGTYILLAAINSHIVLCAILLRPIKKQSIQSVRDIDTSNARNTSPNNTFMKRQLQSSGFNLLCENRLFALNSFAAFLGKFAYVVALLLFVPCVIDKGLSQIQAAVLGTIIGLSGLISRVINGFVSCLRIIDDRYILVFMMFVRGISFILVPLALTFRDLAILAAVIGMTLGVYTPAVYVFIKTLVGVENYAGGIGITVCAFGIAAFIAPSLGGAIFDETGNYDVVFYLDGGTSIISAVLHLTVGLVLRTYEIKRKAAAHRCDNTSPEDLNLTEVTSRHTQDKGCQTGH